MMQRLSILVTFLLVTGFAFAGPTTASDLETDGTFRLPSLHVDPQVTDGSTVTVSRVNANESLWLVIHADENGTFGEVLGNSELLDEGLNVGVDVAVDLANRTDEANDTVTLHAMLHFDDGDGEYEFPDADPPMTGEAGDIIVQRFNVTLSDAQAVVATGSAAFKEDGDDDDVLGITQDSEIEIELARLARPGYVVLHEATDGSPGQVVGNSELLDEGEHEDVGIALNSTLFSLNATSSVLWAMIHFDDGDETYLFPGPDAPVVVGDVPVMTPFPVISGEDDNRTDDEDDADDVGVQEPGEGDDQDTPAPGAVVVALAVIGAAFLMRRRRD